MKKIITLVILILNLFLILKPVSVYASDLTSSWSLTTSLPYLLASHVMFSNLNSITFIGGSALTGASKFDVVSSTSNSDGTLSPWTISNTSLPKALIWHTLTKKDNNVYV